MRLMRPVRGRWAAAYRELVGATPELARARAFTDVGNHVQVDLRWGCGLDPAERVAAVTAAAAQAGTAVQSYVDNGNPRKVTHWFNTIVATPHGPVTVIVAAVLCECHDGLEHTLGFFKDVSEVIGEAMGPAYQSVTGALRAVGMAEAIVEAAAQDL
jgi:hypothetical protein